MEYLRLAGRSFAVLAFVLCITGIAHAQTLDNPRINSLLQAQAPQPINPVQTQMPSAPLVDSSCLSLPFGQSLFEGAVEKSATNIISSKQQIVPGDRVSLAIWGAIQTEETTIVDSQGFIYVKGVGPVLVSGQTEEGLSQHIRSEIGRVFKDDVQVYARLEQNSGTPVLVTGGVARPGQYFGSAEDNVIVWLKRAGGIMPQQGSYRNIQVLRNSVLLQRTDLYPFLQSGIIDRVPWQSGDVIVVGEPGAQIKALGAVRRCASFEFPAAGMTGADLAALAQPLPGTTHALLSGYRDSAPFKQIYALSSLAGVKLQDGDSLQFYAAPQSAQITVHVEGATVGNKILVLPVQAKLSDALQHIPVDQSISDTNAVFIKRASVAAAQQEALDESLKRLLQSALTAPASSDGEAIIRAKEAELIEHFVMRAREVRQEGRVVVMEGGELRDLPLEEGDVIVIPQRTNVVSIEGEVVLPRAVVIKDKAKVSDYVMMAGGYTERALKDDYIIIRPNGDALRGKNVEVSAGDRLLVLPRVDSKNMQTAKDLVQILYQIAVGAGVLVKI
jgi:protein involved in polysaccharide export with SLBB domain